MDESAIERPRVELIGSHLRAEGSVELGRFTRVSDYVNILTGFFNITDVVLLSRIGEPTRITFPEFRVRLDEIAIVGQQQPEANPVSAGPWGDQPRSAPGSTGFGAAHASALEGRSMWESRGVDPARIAEDHGIDTTFNVAGADDPGAGGRVDKERRRIVISTAAHIIYGFAHIHQEASMMAYLDASDPHFIPMTDVRVRWLADRRLAGRYPFALIQRIHIVGVAMDVSGGLSLLKGRGGDAEHWLVDHEGPEPA
ncbi:MAG: hypothetical protein ACHQZR_03160 [Candidatus Limnocylindrales bacterium]